MSLSLSHFVSLYLSPSLSLHIYTFIHIYIYMYTHNMLIHVLYIYIYIYVYNNVYMCFTNITLAPSLQARLDTCTRKDISLHTSYCLLGIALLLIACCLLPHIIVLPVAYCLQHLPNLTPHCAEAFGQSLYLWCRMLSWESL